MFHHLRFVLSGVMEVSYESMLLYPFVTSPLIERQTSVLFKVLDDSYAFINCITNSRVSKLNVSRLVKRARSKRNFYWLIVSFVYFLFNDCLKVDLLCNIVRMLTSC